MTTDNELERFCRNVRFLRTSHGLSKKKMAQLLGIGVHSLNRIEAGDFPSGLGIAVFFRIHSTFGILPSRLVGEELTCHDAPGDF